MKKTIMVIIAALFVIISSSNSVSAADRFFCSEDYGNSITRYYIREESIEKVPTRLPTVKFLVIITVERSDGVERGWHNWWYTVSTRNDRPGIYLVKKLNQQYEVSKDNSWHKKVMDICAEFCDEAARMRY